MNVDFTDLEIELELLAQSTVDVTPQHHLRELEYTYVDAPIHELFDLVEGALETYALVSGQLAASLRETAEAEIEFLMALLQDRLNALVGSAGQGDVMGQSPLPAYLQSHPWAT
jgi:hypothetical protein